MLILTTGFLGFATSPPSPWNEILAAGFGVGAGLTLDEFALWVYLRDVYWAEEGRASLDAVVVAVALGGLIVLGIAPFDLPNNSSSVASLASTVLVVALYAPEGAQAAPGRCDLRTAERGERNGPSRQDRGDPEQSGTQSGP